MKQIRLIWTNEALNDLLALEDYLGFTPTTERTIDRIVARAEQLANFPESGQKQETNRPQDYHYLVEGKYKLIYSYRQDTIYIHAVFDTRQDPGKLKL